MTIEFIGDASKDAVARIAVTGAAPKDTTKAIAYLIHLLSSAGDVGSSEGVATQVVGKMIALMPNAVSMTNHVPSEPKRHDSLLSVRIDSSGAMGLTHITSKKQRPDPVALAQFKEAKQYSEEAVLKWLAKMAPPPAEARPAKRAKTTRTVKTVSGYQLYGKRVRSEEDVKKLASTEIMREIATRWGRLSEKEKEAWKKDAKKANDLATASAASSESAK